MDLKEEARRIASEYGIDPDLFVKLVQAESSFDPDIVGEAGEVGLTQIMENTALDPGYDVKPIENRRDPLENLRFGAEYYKAMKDKFGSDEFALMAYNTGPGNAEAIINLEKTLPPSTEKYIKTILGRDVDPDNKWGIRRREVTTVDPNEMGASGTDLTALLNSQYGALGGTSAKTQEADPALASLLYFSKMGELASQPGATALGSAVSATMAPAEYLADLKKPPKGTPGSNVQSVLKYRNGVAVQTLRDGTTVVIGKDQQIITDPAEKAKAIDEGVQSGVMEAADIAGVSKARQEAVVLSTKNFEDIAKININIANYVAGIRLIDEGADTGYIEGFLPSLRKATIALNTVIGELALDVVGSVAFGALSQGELDLARSVGAPSSLQEEDLRKWFQERIDAKRKLVDYLTQQATFLADGTKTQGDWKKYLKDEGVSPSATIFEREVTEEADATSGGDEEITATNQALIAKINNSTLEELRQMDLNSFNDADVFEAYNKKMRSLLGLD